MKKALAVMILGLVSGCVYCDFSGEWVEFGDQYNAVQSGFPRRVSACGFSDEDTRTIYAAVHDWNDIAGQLLFVVSADGCENSTLADVTFTKAGYLEGKRAATTYQWICNGFLCKDTWVLVYDWWWALEHWHRKALIRHELGHYLGIGHAFDKGCLMDPEALRADNSLCDGERRVLCEHYPNLPVCD
jgi:hypothetical protein